MQKKENNTSEEHRQKVFYKEDGILPRQARIGLLYETPNNELVQELIRRISLKEFSLIVRGIMIRNLNNDEEGLVELELDGESENEMIEIA